MKTGYGLVIIFALIMVLGLIFLSVMHEQVHVQIFKSYGIDSRVEYFKDFPHMTTYGEKPCPSDECKLAHNINDVVDYQLESLYILIGFGLLIIIALLQERIEYCKKYYLQNQKMEDKN